MPNSSLKNKRAGFGVRRAPNPGHRGPLLLQKDIGEPRNETGKQHYEQGAQELECHERNNATVYLARGDFGWAGPLEIEQGKAEGRGVSFHHFKQAESRSLVVLRSICNTGPTSPLTAGPSKTRMSVETKQRLYMIERWT
jgi:hypothetical protein